MSSSEEDTYFGWLWLCIGLIFVLCAAIVAGVGLCVGWFSRYPDFNLTTLLIVGLLLVSSVFIGNGVGFLMAADKHSVNMGYCPSCGKRLPRVDKQ